MTDIEAVSNDNLHPAILADVKTNLLDAQNFIAECRARQSSDNSVDCDEFREKMLGFGFQEFYVNDDLEFYLPTTVNELFISSAGEQVCFETDVFYYYESAAHDNDIAHTKEFSDALDARKAFDCEFGWKSSSIGVSAKKYSRPVSFEEVEKMLAGEAIVVHPKIIDPNTLEYEWTEEETTANEEREEKYWDREIAKQDGEIAAWLAEHPEQNY